MGNEKVRKIALYGIFTGLMVALSIAESVIIPPAFLNIKPGLANIIVMYCLFFMGKKEALSMALLKALFALLTRGAMAGMLSLSGGLASLLIMIILGGLFKEKLSYFSLSIFGGAFHNIGQLVAASVLLSNFYLLYYIPIGCAIGAACGALTGVLLSRAAPYMSRL